MENKFSKYEPSVTEVVSNVVELTMHGHKYHFDAGAYCFYYSKKIPTNERPNRSSKVLEVRIADEFADDNGSIESLKSQLLSSLKSYTPEPSEDNSTNLIIIS